MHSPTLVLDLDGTLADTNRDLIPVLNRTTASRGLEPILMTEVGHIVGHGAKAMIQKAFKYHGQDLSEANLEQLFAQFLVDYEENICVKTVLFDGVIEALADFQNDGWKLAVCTNKYDSLAEKLLKELGIFGYFAAITGGNTFAIRKPDPAHILKTIELAGGQIDNAIMVGDSITDISAAKAGNIPVVAVDFGYTDTPVRELSPDCVISHFSELKSAVNGLI